VGGTSPSGPPVTGTFAVNDYVISATGQTWYCIAGGSPGTWTPPPGALIARAINPSSVACNAQSTVTAVSLAVNLLGGLRYAVTGRWQGTVAGAATSYANAQMVDTASLLNAYITSENTVPLGGTVAGGMTTAPLAPAGNISDTISLTVGNGAGTGSVLNTGAGGAELYVVRVA
jgi:hypothetical protein